LELAETSRTGLADCGSGRGLGFASTDCSRDAGFCVRLQKLVTVVAVVAASCASSSDSTVCSADSGAPPEGDCQQNSQCACPLSCGSLGGTEFPHDGMACLLPCKTGTDCPTLDEHCSGGHCVLNQCFGALSTCDAGGSGDGYCQPEAGGDATDPYAFCVQGGGATGSCSPGADRTELAEACVKGSICVPDFSTDGGGNCQAYCLGTCSNGLPCTGNKCCEPAGAACTAAAECCTGTCAATCCMASGQPCKQGPDCCSGFCLLDGGLFDLVRCQ
jgi:hypothetical protein